MQTTIQPNTSSLQSKTPNPPNTTTYQHSTRTKFETFHHKTKPQLNIHPKMQRANYKKNRVRETHTGV